MSETRAIAVGLYIAVVFAGYLLRKIVYRMAEKAIREKSLSTGIYRFFPVQGEEAIRLAKGYMSAVNIVFWFIVLVFPFMFIISIRLNAL